LKDNKASVKGLSTGKVLGKDKKKKRETWSQTKRQGDTTEEISVEKLDNKGYLVTVSKSWYDTKRNWQHEESKVYSEENPLDENETDNPIDKVASMLVRESK
jgi:hypothetical protein